MKGVGGPLDILSNVIVLILGIALAWYGFSGGSLNAIFLVIIGIALIITQLMAIIW